MTVAELGEMARLMAMPIFLSFVGLVVLVSDLIFDREDERRWPAYLTIAGLLGGIFLWVQSWLLFTPEGQDNLLFGVLRSWLKVGSMQPELLFNNMFNPVGFAGMTLLISLLVIVIALVSVLLAPGYLERRGLQRGEFYGLVLFATAGLIFLAGSTHLILIFLAIELLSIPLYILAGFARPALKSQESALKYFLLGAFSSSILLYGIALVYGATGSMNLSEIGQLLGSTMGRDTVLSINEQQDPNLMLIAGLTMLLVGIGFKLAVVPFHQWTPDVYEGAPTPVTAFMVAGTKAGTFAVLINVLAAFLILEPWWSALLVILALLTMAVGNVGALVQRNIKRMLAYSSIAHAGYVLVALAAIAKVSALILPAVILYLAVYALMNLGAFATVIALEEATGREIVEVEDFRGVGREHPVLAGLLGFFLLSLAGFPPTAGFFAKFFLFMGAIQGGQLWLVVTAVVLSVLSLFYYARYIVASFMLAREEEPVREEAAPQPRPSWMVGMAVAVTALLILAIGLFPNPLLNLIARL